VVKRENQVYDSGLPGVVASNDSGSDLSFAAVRLAGGGVGRIATAGKPDGYKGRR
jgi:hypothetical protein